MSAHGPYVLQDGPTHKFWRDGATDSGARGTWVFAHAEATQYGTRTEAERGRSSLRTSFGRSGLGRVHVVPVADIKPVRPHFASATASPF